MSTRVMVIAACVTAMITSIKVAVSPAVPLALQELPLPQKLPLLSWQQLGSDFTEQKGTYRFRRGEDRLKVEIALHQGGNLLAQTSQRWDIPKQEISIRKTQEIGAYGVFADNRAAYLTACITPDGSTTVTASQFELSRLQQAMQPQRSLTNFLDYTSVADSRCLWVTLSTPLDDAPQSSFRTLQSAWFELNLQWQPVLPKAQGIRRR
ncbi:MAG: cyanoexosortase A system-associated protein [Elainellaceae cyanobacterium]